jgi:hypothetical protein
VTGFIAGLALAIALVPIVSAQPRLHPLGESGDLHIHLVNDEAADGSDIDYVRYPAIISTEDIEWIAIVEYPDTPNAQVRFGFLIQLRPEGQWKLTRLFSDGQDRNMVLRSHEQTFNTVRVSHEARDRLFWGLYAERVAERWLQHFTGEALFPDPFADG